MKNKKYFRTTITIYTEFVDPRKIELEDLAIEADKGDGICTQYDVQTVSKKDLPLEANQFFNAEDY